MSPILDKIRSIQVAGYFFFANTPDYLFRKLISDEMVIGFAHRTATETIAEALAAELASPTAHADGDAYILLAALALKRGPDIVTTLENFDLVSLRWGEQFYDLVRARVVSEGVARFDLSPKVHERQSEPSTKSSLSTSVRSFLLAND